ncbi:MAG TPA: PP2C family protein-serine/threonine phosphatase [Candidatus Eisenbacteria bacterium]
MPDLSQLPATLYLMVGALAVLLGVVIARENARERIHRVTAALLILVGLKAAYEGLIYAAAPATMVAAPVDPVLRALNYFWEFFFPTLVLFASIFPAEHRWMSRIRFGPVLLFLPHTFHFLLLMYLGILGRNDLGLESLAPEGGWLRGIFRLSETLFGILLSLHLPFFSLVNICYVTGATWLLYRSWRATSNPRLATQLRIITIGVGSCVGLYMVAEPMPVLLGIEMAPWIRQGLVVGALTICVGAIAWSIVRYRFLDTQLLARRSILYALVTALLVGAYLTLVRQLQGLLARALGRELTVIEPVFLVLALILFQPVLQRLEEIIDSWFLRDRHDHRNILRGLSRDIISILDRKELTRKIVSTLAEGVMARQSILIDLEAPQGERVTAAEAVLEEAEKLEDDVILAELRLLPLDEDFVHRDQVAGRLQAWGTPVIDLLYQLRVRYLLPIRHGDRLLGLLLLGRKVTNVSYTGEEVSLLSTLANQVGVALQNSALYRQSLEKAVLEEELSLARQIQERLLPAELPQVAPFLVSAINVPSKTVGGDFYDFVELEDGRVLFAIADVAGKGVPAALLTSMLQASLRTQMHVMTTPSRILANLNDLTYRFTAADQFATFFLGVLDPVTRTLVYANAGHNFPMRIVAGGAVEWLSEGGLLLGAFPGIQWGETTLHLGPGDCLVFYTDGVTEARPNGQDEEYGERRFLEQLERLRHVAPRRMMDAILEDVAAYAGDEQADDITLIIIRIDGAHEATLSSDDARALAGHL